MFSYGLLSVSAIAIYALLYFSDNLNFMSNRLYCITFLETDVRMARIIKRDKATVNIQNILYFSVIFHGWRSARRLAALRRSVGRVCGVLLQDVYSTVQSTKSIRWHVLFPSGATYSDFSCTYNMKNCDLT